MPFFGAVVINSMKPSPASFDGYGYSLKLIIRNSLKHITRIVRVKR